MSVKYDDYRIMANKIAYWIIKNNKKVKLRKEYSLSGKKKKYDDVKKIILKNQNTNNSWGRKFLEALVIDNKDTSLFPNFVTHNNKQYSKAKYIYMAKYVTAWWKTHDKAPATVPTEKTTSKSTGDAVCDYFIKVFGKVTTFSQALGKVQGKGYGYYFENKLKNIAVIDGLKKSNGVKPNCVDICQMMWHVAKGLGYDVRCLHVYCPVDKITHVRLQVKHSKHTNGKWENYDPAAVAKGGAITSLWCAGSGSYTIATNPQWFLKDLNK